jgi:hypothetical protein
MAEEKFGDDMVYPVTNSVAEIHVKGGEVEGGSILHVTRGSLGELNFQTDSIGGFPIVWENVCSTFEELEAIYEFMKEHRDLWFGEPFVPEPLEEEEFDAPDWTSSD